MYINLCTRQDIGRCAVVYTAG